MAAIQETHFVCNIDVRVLSSDFVVYSACGNQLARGVSLLVKLSLDVKVDLVHVDEGWGRLIVADITVNNSSFRIIVVYAPNN